MAAVRLLRLLLLACAWAGGTHALRMHSTPGAAVPYWPCKGGNLNHSGSSAFSGPFDLSEPVWTFEEPNRRNKWGTSPSKVFHSSPVIDAELNIYIQSNTGWIYSVDKDGKFRWEFHTNSTNPANMALLHGTVYTTGDDGTAFALAADSGRLRWSRKIATRTPTDTHSLTALDETVLTACNVGQTIGGLSNAVCALSASDGRLKWSYLMTQHSGRKDALACNHAQSIVDGRALFSDNFGGVYCASMADGAHLWYVGNATSMALMQRTSGALPWGTTATSAVGPNGLLYHPFNAAGGAGAVRAHSIADGGVAWQKAFDLEVNAAPAVGLLGPGGPLAVVVALGKNPLVLDIGNSSAREVPARVLALDANTGGLLWTFTPPRWDGTCAGSYLDMSGWGDLCMPDVFGSPAIGADGTVYVNFSGGYAFALRDANGDAVVDLKDPAEVSSYHHGRGANGQTAIAPGFVVVPNCRHIAAFRL